MSNNLGGELPSEGSQDRSHGPVVGCTCGMSVLCRPSSCYRTAEVVRLRAALERAEARAENVERALALERIRDFPLDPNSTDAVDLEAVKRIAYGALYLIAHTKTDVGSHVDGPSADASRDGLLQLDASGPTSATPTVSVGTEEVDSK